ncbi:TIR domain-containing protein [Phreatobacter sp. HK31-P]
MQIFLGYTREDIAHAREVAECLRNAGHKVWRDGDFLVGGDDWDHERLEGQRRADFIIHLISPIIKNRRSVAMREIKTSLRLIEDEPFGSNLAMFMRVQDFPVPIQLTSWHYVDKFQERWQSDLLRAVEKRASQIAGRVISTTNRVEAEAPSTSSDVRQIDIEESDGRDGYDSLARYFKYTGETPFLRLVNNSIASRTLWEHVGWRSEADFLLEDLFSEGRDIGLWRETIATEFFRSEEFLSVRIYHHYYSGGVHPNHDVDSLNFFGDIGGGVNIRQLLNYDQGNAEKLAARCFDIIAANEGTAEDGTTFALTTRDEMAANAWIGLSRFTFDRRGLTFTFPPYEVLAYASGMPEAFIPWDDLEDVINDRYRKIIEKFRS